MDDFMHLHNAAHRQHRSAFVITLLFSVSIPATSQSPTVRIIAPKDGTVVHSGTSFSVTAEATPGAFRGVILTDDGGLGGWFSFGDQALEKPPYIFSVPVPRNAASGIYKIRAAGTRGKDISEWVESPEISIDIERPDQPQTLLVEDVFASIGETITVRVIGAFADGSAVSLTRSTLTTYTVDPPGIVSVEPGGKARARRAGHGRIIIRNGRATSTARVDVQP
jgi:hypothetical protein